MRRIIADLIFPVASSPVEKGMILMDDRETILSVLIPGEEGYDASLAEYFPGWIVPGWVNAHCHLELSHLRNRIPENEGLDDFIENITSQRGLSDGDLHLAMKKADAEMAATGIVLVGDISNGSGSFSVKAESSINYFTFIERFGLATDKADAAYYSGKQVEKVLHALNRNLAGNLSPHAPYSVSKKLLRYIIDDLLKSGGLLSIHNQESAGEEEFFLKGTGKMAERLKKMGLIQQEWTPPGFSSMRWLLEQIPCSLRTLLVHNTFTREEDLADPEGKDIWFCLCPHANLYIENQLPDIDLLRKHTERIVLGTDSLASNHQLDILQEIKTISFAYPDIPVSELFRWGTLSGATFFRKENLLGSIEPGKKPGLVRIKNVDTPNQKLLPESSGEKI